MKSGRDEAARGSIPRSSPRPDREHRKPQPTTCYTVVCVKTAVEISEESHFFRAHFPSTVIRPCPPVVLALMTVAIDTGSLDLPTGRPAGAVPVRSSPLLSFGVAAAMLDSAAPASTDRGRAADARG